jgi:hypothetical protein
VVLLSDFSIPNSLTAVEPQIQEQLEAAKSTDLGDINLANLAPKKVDW